MKRPDPILRRNSDGRLFRSSVPDGYGLADARADFLSGDRSFYFLGVRKVRDRSWFGLIPEKWEDTGEIWTFSESGQFTREVNDE